MAVWVPPKVNCNGNGVLKTAGLIRAPDGPKHRPTGDCCQLTTRRNSAVLSQQNMPFLKEQPSIALLTLNFFMPCLVSLATPWW